MIRTIKLARHGIAWLAKTRQINGDGCLETYLVCTHIRYLGEYIRRQHIHELDSQHYLGVGCLNSINQLIFCFRNILFHLLTHIHDTGLHSDMMAGSSILVYRG